MKKSNWIWAAAVAGMVWAGTVQAGDLTPPGAPGSTMHSLEEIYQKLVDIEARLELAGIGVPLVTIDMVTVGDPGNADDTGGSGVGAVAYEYQIGKYEVSNAEYVQFLNAVDPTGANALALYDTSMDTDSVGGISNNTNAVNGARYVAKPGRENMPVVYVNFYDAMRFCNWLHNGAVAGGDTETGAYTLLGGTAVPTNGLTVLRNAGAKFAVPTEDEWYKAAYYDPVNAGADAGGNADYWLYPTMSDTAPTAENPPGGANSANYDNFVGGLTDVGAYTGSPSHYGTFDQGGNVYEWNERIDGSNRGLGGGTWDGVEFDLRSSFMTTTSPGGGSNYIGFRVARTP